MSKVIVDETLRSKLNGLNTELELCDETGRVLGHFLPADVYKRFVYSSVQCPYSEEELEKHMREPGGRTLQEIWTRLDMAHIR